MTRQIRALSRLVDTKTNIVHLPNYSYKKIENITYTVLIEIKFYQIE